MGRVGAKSAGEVAPAVLDACRRGDRDAFRALCEAYKDRVYSIAFFFFHGDSEAASEVTQQVFLKLIRDIARFHGDAAFSTWLYRLVVNACATTRLAAGEWVETGGDSRARIIVGDIGTVDVEPGARVQLGEVRPTEYRLELARGTIRAEINAPPRLFIVDTPASTVVDLGCAYTATVTEDGAGELHMTQGWSALEWKGRESFVPAGAMARTRPGVGPGIPFFEDAPGALKRAVDAFDSGGGGLASVDVILREARVRDTLTLWHLLSRVEAADRGRVYDRIVALVAPPAAVSRERALRLDRETLRLLREELAWKW